MRIIIVPFTAIAVTFAGQCLGQSTVSPPTVRPAAITAGSTTTMTVTALVTSVGQQALANSVNVLQVDQNGNNARVIGTLNDTGVNGDFFAGDGIFGGTVILSESTAGQVYLQISAAFVGALRRTLSPITSVPVTAPGVPNMPQPSTTQTTIDPQTGATVVCNELLVGFQPGASQQSITSAIVSAGGTLVGMLAQLGVYQVTIPTCNSTFLSTARAALAANPVVNFVELDDVAVLSQISGSPNDPYFVSGQQWGLATIDASSAWSVTSGVPGVIAGATIGIIDTGINSNHEDLLGQVTSGVSWCASVDNSGNCTAVGSNTNDDIGHGTMVAGIAAAITNNDLGIASPAYRAQLIAEKVNFPASPNFTSDAVANAVTDAVFRGARVVNLSLGSTVPSQTLNLAILDAVAKGVVIVAAAGNYGNDTSFFPAAYNSVISVGASDQNNQRATWNFLGIPPPLGEPCDLSEPSSNYGSWVTVYAPGSQVFGLLYNQTSGPAAYGYYGGGGVVPLSCSGDGTSFAAPFVTGATSLMLAVNPNLTPAQVKAIITGSAKFTGNTDPDGNPIFLLNMFTAMQQAVPPVTTIFNTFGPGDSFRPCNFGCEGIGGSPSIPSQQSFANAFVATKTFYLSTVQLPMVYFEGPNVLTVYVAAGQTAPGLPLESFTFTNVNNTFLGPSILTATSLLHPQLTAGNRYWVVVTAPDLLNSLFGWPQSSPAMDGVRALQSTTTGGAWLVSSGLLGAFSVTGIP
jgi:thermitase